MSTTRAGVPVTQLDQMTQRVRRYDTRRRAPEGARARVSQTTVNDTGGSANARVSKAGVLPQPIEEAADGGQMLLDRGGAIQALHLFDVGGHGDR